MSEGFPGGREPAPYSGKGPRLWSVSTDDLSRFQVDDQGDIYLDGVPLLHELRLKKGERAALLITAISAAMVGIEAAVDLVSRLL